MEPGAFGSLRLQFVIIFRCSAAGTAKAPCHLSLSLSFLSPSSLDTSAEQGYDANYL